MAILSFWCHSNSYFPGYVHVLLKSISRFYWIRLLIVAICICWGISRGSGSPYMLIRLWHDLQCDDSISPIITHRYSQLSLKLSDKTVRLNKIINWIVIFHLSLCSAVNICLQWHYPKILIIMIMHCYI